jgi:hypothetical protein
MTPETQAAIRESFHKALPAILAGHDPQPIVWDSHGKLQTWDAPPQRLRRYWTAEEDEVLRTCYETAPKGRRYRTIHRKLPHRTKDAVVSRVRYIGLTGSKGESDK